MTQQCYRNSRGAVLFSICRRIHHFVQLSLDRRGFTLGSNYSYPHDPLDGLIGEDVRNLISTKISDWIWDGVCGRNEYSTESHNFGIVSLGHRALESQPIGSPRP